jgi:hypothetical protein
MSEDVLAGVCRALDLAVIERLPNGAFHAVAPLPEWLEALFDAGHSALATAMPFLDYFLPQAEAAWHGLPGGSDSGPFVANVGGQDILLRASARTVGSRALLVLERMTGMADSREILQKAREQMLEREQIVSKIGTMRQPAATMATTLEQLKGTSLDDNQRRLVDGAHRAIAIVNDALGSLPMPPQKTKKGRA